MFMALAIVTNGQEIKFSDLSLIKFSAYKLHQFESYIAKDGSVFKITDRIKIGVPSSNKTFAFIIDDNPLAPSSDRQLGISSSNSETEIKKIYVTGNKRAGFSVYFRTKGYNGLSNYIIDIENAIASGEIKSFGKTSDEALIELKRAKDKLDLNLITKEKYDSIKTDLIKYIK
jgi:hypothetical protein